MDSELVVKQVSGEFRVKDPVLAGYHRTVLEIIRTIRDEGSSVDIQWVPREEIVKRLGH